MADKYSFLNLARHALSRHQNWDKVWRSPELKSSYDVVIVGGGMAAENERGDNWVSAMVSRSIAAMEDHDCLSLLDRFQDATG